MCWNLYDGRMLAQRKTQSDDGVAVDRHLRASECSDNMGGSCVGAWMNASGSFKRILSVYNLLK